MKGTLYNLMYRRKNNKGPEQNLVVHHEKEQQMQIQWQKNHTAAFPSKDPTLIFVIP